MNLAARLCRLETQVGELPRPRGGQPMRASEFIAAYPDLAMILEYLLVRCNGDTPEIREWEKPGITADKCQRLIYAVEAEDEEARAAGRPLPSSGCLGLASREALVFIDEVLREGVGAA